MTGHRQHGSDLPFNDIVRRHDKAMQYTSHWIQKQLPVLKSEVNHRFMTTLNSSQNKNGLTFQLNNQLSTA